MDLPPEIWLIIIEFAYPINRGWHRGLWQISLVSKMHYGLIGYLFSHYLKKPVISKNSNCDILSVAQIVKILTRDIPLMENGFLLAQKSYKNLYLNFKFTNILTDQNFSETKYCHERCLVAKSYTYTQRIHSKVTLKSYPSPRILGYDYTALLNLCKCMRTHTFTKFKEAFSVLTEKFLHSKNVRKYM